MLTHVIRIGRRYYSARGGYMGRLAARSEATRFTHSAALELASQIANAAAVAAAPTRSEHVDH